jgi:hypothetical protein
MAEKRRQRAEAQIHDTPLEDKQIRKRLLKAIDDSSGRVTSADLVVASGLPPSDVERVLRDIVMTYDCRLEVGDDGLIVYDFGKKPSLRDREKDPWYERFGRWAWKAFTAFFKVMIAVVLVGYVIFFVLLLLAMMFAAQDEDADLDIGGGHSHGHGGGSFWLWFWLFGRDADARHRMSPHARRYASNRSGEAEDDRPFYKKVYSFVFGPEHDEGDILEDEQQILAWIRSEGGVIAPSELAARTGWTLEMAEKESTRLLAAYDGSVEIMNDGTTVYRFKDLMHSEDEGQGAIAQPFWRQWEAKEPVTGNKTGANIGISAMNAFVLVMAGLMFSGLQPGQWASGWGIGAAIVPLVYSLMFFSIPSIRAFTSVRPENKRRRERNIRRAVMRHVFAYSEGTAERIYPDKAVPLIAMKVAQGAVVPDDVETAVDDELRRMAAEYEAEAEYDEEGELYYTFDRIAAEKNAAIDVREGKHKQSDHHWFDADLEAFDEKLAEAGVNLTDDEDTGVSRDSNVEEAAEPAVDTANDDWLADEVPSEEEWEKRLRE